MSEKPMFYIVHFHADGGQACVPGKRCFDNKMEALQFYESQLAEIGHTCIDHTWIEQQESPAENKGEIYPAVARL